MKLPRRGRRDWAPRGDEPRRGLRDSHRTSIHPSTAKSGIARPFPPFSPPGFPIPTFEVAPSASTPGVSAHVPAHVVGSLRVVMLLPREYSRSNPGKVLNGCPELEIALWGQNLSRTYPRRYGEFLAIVLPSTACQSRSWRISSNIHQLNSRTFSSTLPTRSKAGRARWSFLSCA